MSGHEAPRSRKVAPATGVRGGADEAFDNLVRQFSDPYAFIRELIQNSIDAGSLRIDVEVTCEPAGIDSQQRLLGITVADTGEGMTAQIIEDYLLTLFRSTKEDDLTKIGKFGVGFVSVFAINPALVLIDTARAGERWRVLCHPDRTYERLAHPDPMEGTRVEVFKYVSESDAREYDSKVREALERWCAHAAVEINYRGLTGGETRIDRPLGIAAAAALVLADYRSATLRAVAAIPRGTRTCPWHCYYNQGLLLHSAPANQCAPPWRAQLEAVSFKVDSPLLEHTLTRDGVLDGPKLTAIMRELVLLVRDGLVPKAVKALQVMAQCLRPDSPPEQWDEHVSLLAWLLRVAPEGDGWHDAAIIPLVGAPPISLHKLRRCGRQGSDLPLLHAATNDHIVQLARASAVAIFPAPFFKALEAVGKFSDICGDDAQRPVDLHSVYAAPLPPRHRYEEVLRYLTHLLAHTSIYRRTVHVGRLDYTSLPVCGLLYLNQERPFTLTRLSPFKPGVLFGGPRAVVLNEAHPLIQETLALGASAPLLAATLIGRLVAIDERGGETDSSAMLDAALALRKSALPYSLAARTADVHR